MYKTHLYPRTAYVKLTAGDTHTHFLTFTNAINDLSYRDSGYFINNLYQWNAGVAGGSANQPIPLLTEVAEAWDFYRVMGFKINVKFRNDMDIPIKWYVGYTSTLDLLGTIGLPTTATSAQNMFKLANTTANSSSFSSGFIQAGPYGEGHCKRYWNLDKSLGNDITIRTDPGFNGTLSGTPQYAVPPAKNRLAYIIITPGDAQLRDKAATENTVYLNVRITWYCKFWSKEFEAA